MNSARGPSPKAVPPSLNPFNDAWLTCPCCLQTTESGAVFGLGSHNGSHGKKGLT